MAMRKKTNKPNFATLYSIKTISREYSDREKQMIEDYVKKKGIKVYDEPFPKAQGSARARAGADYE